MRKLLVYCQDQKNWMKQINSDFTCSFSAVFFTSHYLLALLSKSKFQKNAKDTGIAPRGWAELPDIFAKKNNKILSAVKIL